MIALLIGSGIGGTGCASRTTLEEVSGASARIRDVSFVGNEALDDKEILEHMNLSETKWFPLPKKRYYFEGLRPVDKKRIEDLYAAHGFYDARVLSITPDFHPRRDIVDLEIVVEEGQPVVTQSIDFEWPEGPPAGPEDRKATPERIQTHCGLKVGAPFDVGEMEASKATMQAALQARGYAFAEVDTKAEVDRAAHTAIVTFELRPKKWVRIGDIEIEGLDKVPEQLVRNEVMDFEGKPYSPKRLEAMEDVVFAMDVFSSVVARIDEEADGDTVDVQLRVSESKPQSIKVGPGLGFEPNRWEQHGEMRYTHTNLFGNLTRFDLDVLAGYAELPALYNPQEHGPIVDVEPRLRKKGLLERKLVWTAAPSFELGIWEGYQFYSPETRLGVSRFFTRFFELGLSHNFRYVDFFSVDPALRQNDLGRADDPVLGLDFRDPYTLSYIEVEAWVRITDRLVDPRHGVVIGAEYNLAGGIFGGMFDYHKITPEARAYWTPIKRRLQFAARGQAGLMFPFGDEPETPIDERYYLGGTNTVRGWGLRRLSPVVQHCANGECKRIPVGGRTMLLGNFETRVRVWKGLWVIAFFDMGDVQPEVRTFRPGEWNYSVGPGLRYQSRIGTFRLDAGFRLNDTVRSDDQPPWALHFGLGEAF